MTQQPYRRPPRLRIAQLGAIFDARDFIQGLRAQGHAVFGGPHAVPQADMVVFKLTAVKSLVSRVRPGQILILVDFCHSLEVLEPLAAQGCHTIVLMPLAPNRYAFLADQEISTVVMELLTTELASVCEHVPAERQQEFVAGFVLSQLASEVYQLGATLQDPSGNSVSSILSPNSEPAEPPGPAKQGLPSWLSITPNQPTPQDSQEHPFADAAAQPEQSQEPHEDERPLLPRQLLREHHLAWCAEALPTDHARSVFYTLLYYGLLQHNTKPENLVAWAKKQQERYGGL
ncbi:hypothetical protein [Corynebacterium matruchotii]|uniref:hypothetical protein n=1 Tax=Corynebacterium matruchotii TaxID=43768 RepID=UPI003C6F3AB9